MIGSWPSKSAVNAEKFPGQMQDPEAFTAHYIARLAGPERANAFHRLIEAGPEILPHLSAAMRQTVDPGIRAQIVEVIGQARIPGAADALATALKDRAPVVWKAALDGLVSLGGPVLLSILQSALASARSGEYELPAEWLTEALEQVRQRA